jgi:hypothetical protein
LLIAGEGLQGSEEGLLSEKYFLALRYYCQPVLRQSGATLGAKLVAKGALVGREMVISKNHEIRHQSDTQHARVHAPSGDALGASWASVRRASTHTGPKHVAHTCTQKHRKRMRCWSRFSDSIHAEQRKPKEANGKPKGSQRETKGSQRNPKGSQRELNGRRRKPKGI